MSTAYMDLRSQKHAQMAEIAEETENYQLVFTTFQLVSVQH